MNNLERRRVPDGPWKPSLGGRVGAQEPSRPESSFKRMKTMREIVAAALWRNNRLDGRPNTYPYERLIEPTQADLLRLADAVLDELQAEVVPRVAADNLVEAIERAAEPGRTFKHSLRSLPASLREYRETLTEWDRGRVPSSLYLYRAALRSIADNSRDPEAVSVAMDALLGESYRSATQEGEDV